MTNKGGVKLIQFLERVWFVVGATSLLIGIYETITLGIEESYIFFIFTAVAGFLYFLRRKQRIRMQEENEDG
ncbi:MAG: hypothetical protein JKY52_03385 [Flavobacteriales bacterium]|nr:hypothetical protein [Flavobacteriales bacterium]